MSILFCDQSSSTLKFDDVMPTSRIMQTNRIFCSRIIARGETSIYTVHGGVPYLGHIFEEKFRKGYANFPGKLQIGL